MIGSRPIEFDRQGNMCFSTRNHQISRCSTSIISSASQHHATSPLLIHTIGSCWSRDSDGAYEGGSSRRCLDGANNGGKGRVRWVQALTGQPMLFVPQPDFGTPPPLDHIEHGLAATSTPQSPASRFRHHCRCSLSLTL